MANAGHPDYSQRLPRRVEGIHLAAYFGLKQVVTTLLKMDHHADCGDSYGRTPLSRAAENGHEAVVRLLLVEDGVNPDAKDRYRRTPLSWAAENGHEAVVRLLLAKGGVDLDSKDGYCRIPLSWAAKNGHERGGTTATHKGRRRPGLQRLVWSDAAVVGRREGARGGGTAATRKGRCRPGL